MFVYTETYREGLQELQKLIPLAEGNDGDNNSDADTLRVGYYIITAPAQQPVGSIPVVLVHFNVTCQCGSLEDNRAVLY